MEEWRPVVGLEGKYEVSNYGRVRCVPRPQARGGLLKVRVSKTQGYTWVPLSAGKVSKRKRIYRLVAEAFLGPAPEGCEVRHLDGNPANSVLANLVYGTRSENNFDRVAHGRDCNRIKTHCPKDHPYDELNTKWYQGRRYCRECHKIYSREYARRQRAKRRQAT